MSYTGKHRAPTEPRRILSRSITGYVAAIVLTLAALAILVSLAAAGSKREDIPATIAPAGLADDWTDGDSTPAQTMVTLPATTATVTLPATTMAVATVSEAPTVVTVTETPAPITVTSTEAPATVVTTEYPADVTVVEMADAATVTSTIERAPVTEYATQDAAPQDGSQYPVCAHEDGQDPHDSPNYPCYWDGGSNGTGERYVVWSADQF